MRLPEVWDGKQWRKATKEEYENEIINTPVYGTANYVFRDVWELPVVDTNVTTGSKVVKCGKTIQFRFNCARTTDTAKLVRAYKLGLDRNNKAGMRFNYQKSGSCFVFETTFCGSTSALEKFLNFIRPASIKSLQVRMRDEDANECSNFKRFEYNNLTLGLIRYLRDTMDIEYYNKVKINDLEVIPSNNRWGVIVKL